jgi:uncharacterized membrane protein YfcA
MLDAFIGGLALALAVLEVLEVIRERSANAQTAKQNWLFAAAVVALGLALAYLLPRPYLQPLRNLAFAVFFFARGYQLAFRRYSDPHERNSRYLGWFFLAFSLAMALSAFV